MSARRSKASKAFVGKITEKKLIEVIRAGVGAQLFAETAQKLFEESKETDADKRQAEADEGARKMMSDPVAGDLLKEKARERADSYLEWIKGQRCEKETFARAVRIHASATVCLVVVGFVLVFCVKFYVRLNPDSWAAGGIDKWVIAAVNVIEPETRSGGPPPGPTNTAQRQHKAKSLSNTGG